MDTGAKEKTLEEIRQEVLLRAEKHLSPFNHVRLDDAKVVVQALKSLDRDHWAEEWCRAGLPYEAKGDELAQRKDIDGSRIGVWGGSFGAYWAARLAFVEAGRLKGAVFQGGSVHYGFQEKWLRPAFATGASGYLFGPGSMFEARIYPKGSHMGRTPGMPEDEITKLITGWLAQRLAGWKNRQD